jgi:hypothetical protein
VSRLLARAALLGILPQVAACVSVNPYPQRISSVCNFDPVGPDVYIRCSDGPWFVGPVKGGFASGQDGHGHELFANVMLLDGRYSITEIEPAR